MQIASSCESTVWETLGYNLGWVLGCLSSIPFLRFGRFANADLALTTDGMPTDLTTWADHFRATGRIASWSDRDWSGLLVLIDLAEHMLDNGENEPRVGAATQ